MVLERVQCSRPCRPDSRIVIDERGPDHVDNNLTLVTLALRVGRTLSVKPSTQRKRHQRR
jgi:hypothetical protein